MPDPTKYVGLVLGPLLFALVWAWPMEALSPKAHLLAAVFAWTVTYWVTEALPVPVTAVFSSVLSIALGIAPARTVLASYGDPIIFLFIGSFIIAEAMKASRLDRRFAFALLRHRWATRSPARLMGTVGVVTCAISLWVSNTATTAMMLPVGLGILGGLGRVGDPKQSRFPVGFSLMLAWSSSVAVGLPIGSPPNLIAIGMVRDLTDRRLSFFDWVAVTMPLTVVMLILVWVILRLRYGEPMETSGEITRYVAAEREKLRLWSGAERNVLCVFLLACTLWMLPGAVTLVSSAEAPLPRFFETY